MLKVELHTHTADDPVDRIPHTSLELIDRAAALGYGAIAITLHDRQLDVRELLPYAAERGVVLIPGVERTIQGRHVLLLNFNEDAEQVSTFDDLARLKNGSAASSSRPIHFFRRRAVCGECWIAIAISSTPWNTTRCTPHR